MEKQLSGTDSLLELSENLILFCISLVGIESMCGEVVESYKAGILVASIENCQPGA